MKKTFLPLLLLPASVFAQEKPNVIVILADDLGYGDLQAYGATAVKTPATQKLADEGIKFTNVHSTASISTPSRYSLLTGHYAWRRKDTGIAAGNAKMIIQPHQFTLADAFKSSGYQTAAIGKWHLGIGHISGEQDWNASIPCNPSDLGFDYHYIMAATADRVPCVFIENGKVSSYDKNAEAIEVSYHTNFPNTPTGRENPELLYNLKSSHGHDQSIVNGIGRIGYMKGGGKALWKDENLADSITAHACNFIRENQTKPFFLYFCTNDIHVPRFPHERFRGKNQMGFRGDAIEQFDWSVQQLLNTLDSLNLTNNTLILLTSDNGPVIDDGYQDRAVELLGTHTPSGHWRGNKYSSFEGGTAVPCIIRYPKIVQPQTSDALISHIDILASFAELLECPIPKGEAPDSRSVLSNFLGKTRLDRDFVVEQSLVGIAVRDKDWKYIEPSTAPAFIAGPDVQTGALPEPQLFALKKSNNESNNLALKFPEIVFRFQNLLSQIRAATL